MKVWAILKKLFFTSPHIMTRTWIILTKSKSEQNVRSSDRVVYQYKSPEIRCYINPSSNYEENKIDVQFQWILYNCNVECPRGDDTRLKISYHKAILKSSEKWHDSLEGCFRDFYKTMICSEGNPKASESGELVIFVRNVLCSKETDLRN